MPTKLSIITINRNNAHGLSKTMKSVLNQTFNAFEYIVIDGASTDSSLEIMQQFDVSTIQCFAWISEPDSGVYAAMNKGIRMSHGEYILFLNSGDFLINNSALQTIFSEDHTADFLLCKCNLSDHNKIVHTTTPPQYITFGFLYGTGLAHQATLIARRMFDCYGLYREDYKYNSDIEFWFRTIILNGCTTETIDVVISDYNLNGISSQDCMSEAYKKEINDIFAHPVLKRFVYEYNSIMSERKEMEPFQWAMSKTLINKAVRILYKSAIISRHHKS